MECDNRYYEFENRGKVTRWEYWWSSRTVQLRPGLIGPMARRVFTQGHCHSMALAICELVPGAEPVFANGLGHVVAELPDGRYIDVEGICSHISPRDCWLSSDDEWLNIHYKAPRADDAIPYARRVLETFAPEYAPTV